MQERHIPGVAVAVVKNGTVIRSAGYGLADVEHEARVDGTTVFKIGSVSKQFIAAGIMLLVQDGKLRLDDGVRQHLPAAPPTWNGITIRHLLTHTSGLVREAPGFDPYKIQPDIDVIKTAFDTPLATPPGEKWEYSNLGYYTLAEVIRLVSGQSWESFFQDRIFRPLGMTNTRPTTVATLIPNRADGYLWDEERLRNAENWTTVRPSGAFLSTVLDLAKWDAALSSNELLTAASKREMWTPVKLNGGGQYPYGFGWEIDDYPAGQGKTGVPLIRHEGSIPGFRAVYWRLPDQRLSVIVLSNLERAALDIIAGRLALAVAPELRLPYLRRWPE